MKTVLRMMAIVTLLLALLSINVFAATDTYDGFLEIQQNAADENIVQGPYWFAQENSDWTDLNEDTIGDWINLPYVDWGTHFTHWSGGTSPQVGADGGVLVINAGEHAEPANEMGAIAFKVPSDGSAVLYPNSSFTKFEVYFPDAITAPINVQILLNDEVVWPETGNWFELSSSVSSVDFPTLTLNVKANDWIRVVAKGSPTNTWQNHIKLYPMIDFTAAGQAEPTEQAEPTVTEGASETDDVSPSTADSSFFAFLPIALSGILLAIFSKKAIKATSTK